MIIKLLLLCYYIRISYSFMATPDIYTWLEQNSYICDPELSTFPNALRFLSPDEARSSRCSCGDVMISRSACGRRPRETPSCRRLPDLCMAEYLILFDETPSRKDIPFATKAPSTFTPITTTTRISPVQRMGFFRGNSFIPFTQEQMAAREKQRISNNRQSVNSNRNQQKRILTSVPSSTVSNDRNLQRFREMPQDAASRRNFTFIVNGQKFQRIVIPGRRSSFTTTRIPTTITSRKVATAQRRNSSKLFSISTTVPTTTTKRLTTTQKRMRTRATTTPTTTTTARSTTTPSTTTPTTTSSTTVAATTRATTTTPTTTPTTTTTTTTTTVSSAITKPSSTTTPTTKGTTIPTSAGTTPVSSTTMVDQVSRLTSVLSNATIETPIAVSNSSFEIGNVENNTTLIDNTEDFNNSSVQIINERNETTEFINEIQAVEDLEKHPVSNTSEDNETTLSRNNIETLGTFTLVPSESHVQQHDSLQILAIPWEQILKLLSTGAHLGEVARTSVPSERQIFRRPVLLKTNKLQERKAAHDLMIELMDKAAEDEHPTIESLLKRIEELERKLEKKTTGTSATEAHAPNERVKRSTTLILEKAEEEDQNIRNNIYGIKRRNNAKDIRLILSGTAENGKRKKRQIDKNMVDIEAIESEDPDVARNKKIPKIYWPTILLNSSSPCDNNHPLCQYWSFYKQCYRNPEYMLKYCRQSCGVCEFLH